MARQVQRLAVVAALAGLLGCAEYRPLPLPDRAHLATGLASLDLGVPPAFRIDLDRPLTIDEIGLLAIRNNPGLRSKRGEMAGARAALLQASLLPNPSATIDYGVLLGGPGTADSFSAALSQELASLVARPARVGAAKAHVAQVDADLLWREWQVAQKVRQLALDIETGGRELALTRRELGLLAREIGEVRAAVAVGNLNLAALSPLLAEQATAEAAAAGLRLTQLKNWQALDGLLGLVASVRFRIAPPVFGPPPVAVERLVATLPTRRPDLVALRFGYRSAEENVRAAILGQFPALTLGAAYTSDTTKVVSAGPSLTLGLPVFDRNQGHIAATRASRELLREQYQARLDGAVAGVDGLEAQIVRVSADLARARRTAAAARSLASTASQAYAQGNLDARALTDYDRTALARELEVVRLERVLGNDRIVLAVELGLGLPHMRIAPAAEGRR